MQRLYRFCNVHPALMMAQVGPESTWEPINYEEIYKPISTGYYNIHSVTSKDQNQIRSQKMSQRRNATPPYIYIYIYIYMCVCVCVCVCGPQISS